MRLSWMLWEIRLFLWKTNYVNFHRHPKKIIRRACAKPGGEKSIHGRAKAIWTKTQKIALSILGHGF